MRQSNGRGRAEAGGFVLVAILVLVMLVSMVAVSLIFRLRAEEASVEASGGGEQAWAAALAGVREAMEVAAKIKPGSTEWQDDPRVFRDRLVFEDGSDRWFFTVWSAAGEEALAEVQHGLTDEARKLNVNAERGGDLAKLSGMTPALAAAVRDYVDFDDFTSPEGAEQDYYNGLAKAHTIRNGPLAALDDLLLVRGFTHGLLHGEDANMNRRLDLNENDGDERFPADNSDGKLDAGLSAFLTVVSSEPNEDNDGVRRTDVNDASDPLPGVEFPPGLTNYIAALRAGGTRLGHAAEILEGKVKTKDEKGVELELPSGVGKNELPQVLDLFTATASARTEGLVNVNTASIKVLAALPGIDEPLAEAIASTRRSISPERRTTIAWLYQEDVVDAAKFREIAPRLTARACQYSFNVAGYGLPSGRFKHLEVMIDVAEGTPRVLYLRDLTRLGMPFKFEAPAMETAPGKTAIAPHRKQRRPGV